MVMIRVNNLVDTFQEAFQIHVKGAGGTLIFLISTWPHKHMKAFFFEKIKHIAHEAFDEKK